MRLVLLALALLLPGCLGPAPAADEGPAPPPPAKVAPPTLPRREPFEVEGCEVVHLTWNVPFERVAPLLGNYTPAALGGRVVAVGLRGIDCPSAVAGSSAPVASGGLAVLVGIARPEDTAGEEAPGWVAMPLLFGWQGPVAERFAAHGFTVIDATFSIETTPVAGAASRYRMSLETATGGFVADVAAADGAGGSWRAGLVAPLAGRFSAIVGEASVASRGSGSGTVEWSGSTELDALGLEGPPIVTHDGGLRLDFEFVDAAGS